MQLNRKYSPQSGKKSPYNFTELIKIFNIIRKLHLDNLKDNNTNLQFFNKKNLKNNQD